MPLGSLASSLASTSYSAAATSTAGFHTSRAVSENKQRKAARLRRKANEEKQELKALLFARSKPHPVLGHQMNEEGEALWKNSELAGLILSKDEVWGYKEDRRGNLVAVEGSEESEEKRLNFGLGKDDADLLFKDLPGIMVDDNILDSPHIYRKDPEGLEQLADEINLHTTEEAGKAGVLARVLALQNASGKGIQVENVRRITNHFGARTGKDSEKGLDTGSPEVQGGCDCLLG